jgi:hypothetical protein
MLMFACMLCAVRKRKCTSTFQCPPRKRQRNDSDRARRRLGLENELLQLPNAFFARMFRLPKQEFLWLVAQVTPILRATWTSKSARMATLSSGGEVGTFLLVAGALRWLAGGSVYDIAFMLKFSDKTLHYQKYHVMRAICTVLSGEAPTHAHT